MARQIARSRGAAILFSVITLVAFVTAPAQAQTANALPGHALLGGPNGVVKSSKGDLLEGMMVQLISQKTAIRTAVYSNADGRYEFPKLQPGTYTLRIAQPREFHAFVKEGVAIDGATPLDDIALSRVTGGEVLPPTPEIAAQMTGSEWLASLSGT